jgi:hypothetical protein
MKPIESLERRVERIVGQTPLTDIHTHLYDPHFKSLLLWGIDDLLVYHYLVSEAFRQVDLSFEDFWRATKQRQAEWIWEALFVRHTPISEACSGVITTLNALGLDARRNNLEELRQWFGEQNPEEYLGRILDAAKVDRVYMTNSPFDNEERPYWEAKTPRDPRFVAALRIDPLLLAWPEAARRLKEWGYEVALDRSAQTAGEIRRFLADWTRRIDSRYCMVSLPPSWGYPDESDVTWLLDHAVLPHGREHSQPLALMLGVTRAVNPSLRMAGDGVGRSELSALRNLCAGHSENRFLATCLSRENQHELVVLARKFRNLHPFGCWWFTNTPGLVAEITQMRLELLGTSFTAQHSDARVLDQLIYKWQHTRGILARCLAQRYGRLAEAGWLVSDEEIQRDTHNLLGGAFDQFCG